MTKEEETRQLIDAIKQYYAKLLTDKEKENDFVRQEVDLLNKGEALHSKYHEQELQLAQDIEILLKKRNEFLNNKVKDYQRFVEEHVFNSLIEVSLELTVENLTALFDDSPISAEDCRQIKQEEALIKMQGGVFRRISDPDFKWDGKLPKSGIVDNFIKKAKGKEEETLINLKKIKEYSDAFGSDFPKETLDDIIEKLEGEEKETKK